MSLAFGTNHKSDWEEINKSNYSDHKIKFIKKFRISNLSNSGAEPWKNKLTENKILREIIEGEGYSDLVLGVDFEVEFDGEKYVLIAGMQYIYCHYTYISSSTVRLIRKTRESKRLLTDIARKFKMLQENKEKMDARFFSEFPVLYYLTSDNNLYFLNDGSELFESLDNLIDEMEIVTEDGVFNTLREYVQKHALEDLM